MLPPVAIGPKANNELARQRLQGENGAHRPWIQAQAHAIGSSDHALVSSSSDEALVTKL